MMRATLSGTDDGKGVGCALVPLRAGGITAGEATGNTKVGNVVVCEAALLSTRAVTVGTVAGNTEAELGRATGAETAAADRGRGGACQLDINVLFIVAILTFHCP